MPQTVEALVLRSREALVLLQLSVAANWESVSDKSDGAVRTKNKSGSATAGTNRDLPNTQRCQSDGARKVVTQRILKLVLSRA